MGRPKVQELQLLPNEDILSKRWKRSAPLEPMNNLQALYIQAINRSPYIIATGLPGTSKTYIPTRIASLWLQQGAINKIYLIRPAVSMSKSLGFFKGDANEKMKMWVAPIMSALEEEFPYSNIEYMLKPEIAKIVAMPLETIKGNTFKDCFVIIDEACDLNLKEVKALLTRLGTNCTMVFCGDIDQSDIPQSGIAELLQHREQSEKLQNVIQHIHFNDFSHIVRSEAVRDVIECIYDLNI